MHFESYSVTACLGNWVLETLLAKPPHLIFGWTWARSSWQNSAHTGTVGLLGTKRRQTFWHLKKLSPETVGTYSIWHSWGGEAELSWVALMSTGASSLRKLHFGAWVLFWISPRDLAPACSQWGVCTKAQQGLGMLSAWLAASRKTFSELVASSEVWTVEASSGIHMQGQAALGSLFSRRECYPVASNTWKPAFFNRMSMWGFSSPGTSQRPSGSKQVNQTKSLAKRNFPKKALEALLEDLANPTAALCGQPVVLLQLSRFSPIIWPAGIGRGVRCWIALHWLLTCSSVLPLLSQWFPLDIV